MCVCKYVCNVYSGQQMFWGERSNLNCVCSTQNGNRFPLLSISFSPVYSCCNINSSLAIHFRETCSLYCLVLSTPVLTPFLFLSTISFTFCACSVRLSEAVKAVWSLIPCPLTSSHHKILGVLPTCHHFYYSNQVTSK